MANTLEIVYRGEGIFELYGTIKQTWFPLMYRQAMFALGGLTRERLITLMETLEDVFDMDLDDSWGNVFFQNLSYQEITVPGCYGNGSIEGFGEGFHTWRQEALFSDRPLDLEYLTAPGSGYHVMHLSTPGFDYREVESVDIVPDSLEMWKKAFGQ